MFAVIPARNEEKRITAAVRAVRQAGIRQIVIIVNGCHDNTRDIVRQLQGDDLTVITFREPLGVDIPRAVGAAYACHRGAAHVLFYDGDLIGYHQDELVKLIRSAERFAIDLALTDTYGTTYRFDPARDLQLRLRLELNSRIGLTERIGLSNPAHGPHIVSRRLLEAIPLTSLAKPPLVLAQAAQSGLKVDALAHIPHARLGSAHKGPTHYERIRETIVGDLLEAIAKVNNRPLDRMYRGLYYDGYDSERRFDLLERFARSLSGGS